MNRRQLLSSTVAGFAGRGWASPAQATPQPAGRPNILFLMTDEHRFDGVGYTNPAVKTPHLDRLAKESVVFENAYSTSPSCVPARAAIYTGRYPSQCGAPTYITYLPGSETTFMSRLQKAGYYTAAIGKQHFGETEIRHGYDYEDLVDFESATGQPTSYSAFLAQAGIQPKQMRKALGRYASTFLLDQRYHMDDFVGEQARRWVQDKLPRDKSWFLTVSFHGPHQPFDGLGLKYERWYRPEDIPLPETDASHLAGKPPHFRAQQTLSSAAEIRRMRLSYYSKISLVDDKIGGILDALRASGQYDNTLIVFAVDHGDFMGDFGLAYKGQYLSEVLMRIPMLAKPPVAGYAGRREKAFVQNFDIGPTCLALAGVAAPPEMAAEDLSRFWRRPETAARRQHCFLDGHSLQGVRDQNWKLVHYRGRPYGELYDLKNDPWEKRNLWDDPAARVVKGELHSRLADHLISTTRRSEARWNEGSPEI
jgi:uncharacterized sulfatase